MYRLYTHIKLLSIILLIYQVFSFLSRCEHGAAAGIRSAVTGKLFFGSGDNVVAQQNREFTAFPSNKTPHIFYLFSRCG